MSEPWRTLVNLAAMAVGFWFGVRYVSRWVGKFVSWRSRRRWAAWERANPEPEPQVPWREAVYCAALEAQARRTHDGSEMTSRSRHAKGGAPEELCGEGLVFGTDTGPGPVVARYAAVNAFTGKVVDSDEDLGAMLARIDGKET